MSRCCGFFILMVVIFVAGTRLFALEDANPPEAKLPIPDLAAQQKARKQINATFAGEISNAKKPTDKAAIAKRLLQAGQETKGDPASKYELLEMARELSVAGRDVDCAFGAIAELNQFAVDSVKLKSEALVAIVKSTSNSQDAQTVAANGDPLIDEAIRSNRFVAAKQLAELQLSTARAARDASAMAVAKKRVDDVREIESASLQATKAADALATKPNDAGLCLTVGRFESFFKGNWEKGLPLLASGSDAHLKQLAEAEVAASSDGDKQLQLADQWWEVSLKERGVAQSNIQQHAAHWYKMALPHLSGLPKARAEQRVSQIKVAPAARGGWVNLLQRVKPERDAVKGEWSLQGGLLTVAASPRAILRVPVTPEKAYELRVEYQRTADGNGESFGIHLPVAESGVVVMIMPSQMGLDMVNGKTWGTNETLKNGKFGGDKNKHTLNIAVWQNSSDARIIVLFDGKPQIDWHGPASSLTIYGPSAFPAPMSLGLLSINVPYAVSSFALHDLGDDPPPRKGK